MAQEVRSRTGQRTADLLAIHGPVENESRRRLRRKETLRLAEVALEIEPVGEPVHTRLLVAEFELGPKGRHEHGARRFESEPRALGLARAEVGAQNEMRCIHLPPCR